MLTGLIFGRHSILKYHNYHYKLIINSCQINSTVQNSSDKEATRARPQGPATRAGHKELQEAEHRTWTQGPGHKDPVTGPGHWYDM